MEHLRRHTLDLVDWIDYRPSLSWWPILVALLGAIWLGMQLPPVMQVIALGATVVLTAVAFLVCLFVLGLMVAFRAVADGVRDYRMRPRLARTVGRVGLADR